MRLLEVPRYTMSDHSMRNLITVVPTNCVSSGMTKNIRGAFEKIGISRIGSVFCCLGSSLPDKCIQLSEAQIHRCDCLGLPFSIFCLVLSISLPLSCSVCSI